MDMSETSIRDRIRYRRENAVEPESFLQEVGAVREDQETDDLAFTDRLASSIADQVARVETDGVTTDDIARIFGVPSEEVTVAERPYTAYKVIHTIRNWPSDAALILDVASDAAMRDLTDTWADVPPRQRYRMLQAFRSFHERCAFCDGELILDDDLVPSCCSDRLVVTVHCEGCDRRFLEFGSKDDDQGGPVTPSALP